MDKGLLKFIGLAVSGVGAVLGIIGTAIDSKRQEVIIEEKVNKAFERKEKKEAKEETAN